MQDSDERYMPRLTGLKDYNPGLEVWVRTVANAHTRWPPMDDSDGRGGPLDLHQIHSHQPTYPAAPLPSRVRTAIRVADSIYTLIPLYNFLSDELDFVVVFLTRTLFMAFSRFRCL
jgi:hypothetical protein